MTLERLIAFTVNPDHGRHVQVWDAVKNFQNKEPYAIRCMLTETSVRASDCRAFFVGVDAYDAEGGAVLRDLFQGDDGGWLEDPALLDRLEAGKLQAEAEALTAEVWKCIDVATDLPYGYSHGFRRPAGDPAPMTDEESAAHVALISKCRALKEDYPGQNEYPEDVDAQLGQLEIAMEVLEQRPLFFDQAEVGRAGVFVTLDRDGGLSVYRGQVQREDEPREETAVRDGDGADAVGQGGDIGGSGWQSSGASIGRTVIASSGRQIDADSSKNEDDGALKPLPERLVMELTAQRTLALREAIGRSPDVALTLLLLKLVTDTFRTSSASGCCLEASVHHVCMSAQVPDLKDSIVARLVDERHAAWEADLPLGGNAALWDYRTVLDQGKRGVIEGLLPHGPQNIRDVLAPHSLKRTGSYEQASYAVQDTRDIVAQHYGRFLPQDKSEIAARILHQVREAA